MYELSGKVRYSEVDKNSRLTWPALLNYFQDCSVSHSESLGVGVEYLEKNCMAWMLTSWLVEVNEMPRLNTPVRVQTWPYDFKGLYGYRNFRLLGEDGRVYACADTTWALIDTGSGRPLRVSKELAEVYGLDPRLPMEQGERRILIPETYEQQEPIRVQRYFIDTNDHMNNEKYVMVAQEFVPADFQIGCMQADYKRAAVYEDVIVPRVTAEEDRITVNLVSEEGKPYSVVKFCRAGEK